MFANITLATPDVERTARFFEQTLGWRPVHRPDNIGRQAAWLEVAPGQQIHLLEVPGFEASSYEQEFGRHIAVFHPGREFEALKQRLADQGAELIDPVRSTPFARFFFRDPNGYVFEVIDRDEYVAE